MTPYFDWPRQMKKMIALWLAALLLLAGCDTPVNEKLISTTPADPQQFAEAKRAAAICARHIPNWAAIETSLKAAGYSETADQRLIAVQRSQRVAVLEKTGTDTIVLVGSKGNEGACIVGLIGMTPQQSFELAQPWAEEFGGRTNAERGQGLARNAVQAWGTLEEDRIVYIAAYRTWDVLDAPGAAARLLYIRR